MIDQAPVTDDEFQTWLTYPTTKWILEAARMLAADRRESWMAMSWEGGKADPEYLRELRGQHDAHAWLADIDYDAVCAATEQEPVSDSR